MMRFLLCLEHCYVAKLDSSAQYADTTGEHNILTPSSSLIFRKKLRVCLVMKCYLLFLT